MIAAIVLALLLSLPAVAQECEWEAKIYTGQKWCWPEIEDPNDPNGVSDEQGD